MTTQRTQFNLLQDDGHRAMTVFIHGYSAIKNQDEYQELVDRIHSLQLPGQVYLVYWGSGSFEDASAAAEVVGTVGRHAVLAITRKTPYGIAAEVAIRLYYHIAHFKYYERKAENLSKSLVKMIRRRVQAHPRIPITLCGHSLGARAIHWSLKHSDWSGLNLQNLIFLAGKTPVDDDEGEWSNSLKFVKGKVYNFYSDEDLVLGVAPDTESCIGAYRLSGPPGKIVNIHTGLWHTQYWDNIRRCFDSKRMPPYTRSKTYPAPMQCYRCDETLYATSDVLEECPECGLLFKYDHEKEKFHFDKEYPEPLTLSCPHCDDEDGDLEIQVTGDYECQECGESTTVIRKGQKLIYQVPCEECDCTGFIECDVCFCDGEIDCPACKGEGEIECGYCQGDGCGHCDDNGERDCRRCDGDGKIPCRHCDDDCEIKCPDCNGKGTNTETQNGSGGHPKKVVCAPLPKPFK